MTVAPEQQNNPEPPEGPAPCLRHVVQMSNDDLRGMIAPCIERVGSRQLQPWPAPPMLSPADAQDWLEYIVFQTADILNDRSAAWSWDGIDISPELNLTNQLIATCWTDGVRKPLILFVSQPALLSEYVWSDFETLRSMPKNNVDRPWTPAECLYSAISRICKDNEATFFLLTSYSTWMFGVLDHYAGACRVTAPLNALACPAILLAWIYSASGYEGGISSWDYVQHQLQNELDSLILSQFAEFERLAYEVARENSVKLSDDGATLQRRRRHEEARHALERKQGQKQKAILDSLNAHKAKRLAAELRHLSVIPPSPAFSSPGTPANCSDAGAATPSRTDADTPRPSSAGMPSSIATPSSIASPALSHAPLRPQSSLHLNPQRFMRPQVHHFDGLTNATPTVPDTPTGSTPSSSSSASDASICSDWTGMDQPSPPRAAHAHHTPSSSIESVANVENLLAQQPSPSYSASWDIQVQAGFREHLDRIGVFPVVDSQLQFQSGSWVGDSPGQILPSDSALQVGGFHPDPNAGAWDMGNVPRMYPQLSPIPMPMGDQQQQQYAPLDMGLGWDGAWNGMDMQMQMPNMQMNMPLMNQGY